MPLITNYNESEVMQYMEDVLGDTAHKLGWDAASSDFQEPVNEVLLLLDEADFTFVDTAAEAKKVRLLARMEAWRAAMYYSVHESSYSAGAPGTGQTNRADIHRHAKAMYELAKMEVGIEYPELAPQAPRSAGRHAVDYEGDVYAKQGDLLDVDDEYDRTD